MKKADNEKKASTENTTKRGNVYEWIQCIIMALIVCVVVFVFFVRLVDVVGSSMYPTLENGDKMIVTDVFYKPKYGDIVVFQKDEYADYALVKRVIATEGQTLDIDFEKQTVTVDGKVIDEPYTQGQTLDKGGVIPKVIPEGKVFVMGDNRTVSLDSRSTTIGLIDEMDIIGKAQLVVFPFNDAKTLF